MMHAEKKRLAAAFVDGALPAKTASAAAASAEDGGGEGGRSSTRASGPTFEVWSSSNPRAMCIECEDTEAKVWCEVCDEAFCALCWTVLHRRGERAKHDTTPLGSAEDLAPPPEALEGSGWLAGVWPSQKPKTKPRPHPAAAAAAAAAAVAPAAAGASSSSPTPPPSSAATPKGASNDGDGNGGSVSPARVIAAAAAEPNGNGGTSSRGAGPQAEGGSGKSVAAATAVVAAAAAANGPRKHAAPVASPGADGALAGPLAGKGNGSGSENGNGSVAAVRISPKKPKLNGSASAATAAAAAADATPTSPQSMCKMGRRPDGYEGPLCPSGEFFSKPQTPKSPSASRSNGAKRPRSPSLHKAAQAAGEPPGTDKPVAAAAIAAEAASTSNGGGLGLDKNGGEAGVAEGRGQRQGQGQGQGRILEKIATAAAVGERVGGSGGSAAGGVGGSNGEAGLHSGQGQTNGCSGSATATATAAATAAAAGQVTAEPAAEDVDGMDVEPPLLSTAAIAAAAAAGGKVDVEVPLLPAAASKKDGGKVGGAAGAPVGDDAAVGPAREATAAEQKSLADLKRRATNIPLRLDPRERAILGVLEGSLHHMQYTDAVDRILRTGRLSCVLENLKKFFTSAFGMYKASGVSPPTYTPPAASNGLGGTAKRNGHGMPASRSAFPVLPPPSDGGGGSSSSSGIGGGGSGWPAADGRGGGRGNVGVAAGGRAGGGARYRLDSFAHKRTSWKYTLDWACILRTCCEVGRRHKILNPEKMRSAHGMLMCILMDTEHPQVVAQTGFSCVRPMRTAFGLSASTELMGLFDDPDLLAASRPVLPWAGGQRLGKSGRGAEEMALQAKEKAEARRRLVARHGTGGLSGEVTLLVDSVADSIVYREISTRPIRRMMSLLRHHWHPDRIDEPSRKNISLAIQNGEHGARLTHNHKTQFYFVLQSLSLWLEVVDHMLELWAAGERDMLDEHNQYNLMSTGQGLQRVQGAGRVGKRMREYQTRVQKVTGHPWVGSAVVHLGDNCVPNALTFLDKYSQVPWILNPILQCLDYLSDLDNGSDPAVLGYVKHRWGNVEYAQRYILRNFFRFGFDGSGAENSYDAGSCVDGRLTSTWNWCSKLEKKSFLNIFMLSGFAGFDGDFSR